MNELTTHAGAMLLRVCVFGPFAYIGLLMVIDPLGFRGLLKGLQRPSGGSANRCRERSGAHKRQGAPLLFPSPKCASSCGSPGWW
jgi:hypothetical protein